MISTEGRRSNFFHQPVMADEVSRYLITRRDGAYLDMTCGGGGHLKKISRHLSKDASLIGLDRDDEAVVVAKQNLKNLPQMTRIINSRFGEIDQVLKKLRVDNIDGVLFDFGISSHQIDSPERGFSFMHDGPLDMRMDRNDSLTAETVINEYPENRLAEVFKNYGEERKARKVASAVVRQRSKDRFKTTFDFTATIRTLFPGKELNKTLARLFQAIRIEVNGEMDELKTALPKAFDLLVPGGRLVCISYHSLEDRQVKQFLVEKAKGCICPDNFPVCTCGKKPEAEILTRRVLRPGTGEMEKNSRARSARLRAAARI